MQERRHQPRKLADSKIQVRNVLMDAMLGTVVNLTSDGMMLLVAHPIESNLVFQLEIALPRTMDGHDALQIGAESLWCSNANEPGRYWTGFRIIDIAPEAIEIIESLITSWEIDDQSH